MKKLLVIAGFSATFLLGGCASHIKISKEQAATMSQQAVDTLKTFKYLKLPVIKATDKMRLMGREQFATYEKWQVADMHKRFDFIVTDTIIENVKVNIIQPKNIKPENNIVIGFHIHGGVIAGKNSSDKLGLMAYIDKDTDINAPFVSPVKDIIINDDKVVLYFSNSGLNVGDFMGYKASNKTAIWDGIGIYRIANGKIAEAWFAEDILGMFLQLGFIKN